MTSKEQRGIYIHIPFCARKCVYCDFLSAPRPDAVVRAYFDALIREIRMTSREETEYGPVFTVFFGGGTPGLVPAAFIARVLSALRENLKPTRG